MKKTAEKSSQPKPTRNDQQQKPQQAQQVAQLPPPPPPVSAAPYSCKDGFKDFRNLINILILEANATVTVYVLYMAIKYKKSNSMMLHICFATVGYALLMTSAIMLFAGDNIFGRPLNRYHKYLVHAVTIGIGSVLALTGISIEIDSRGDEWPHFSSTHAITGLVSMILMIIACCAGVLAGHAWQLRTLVPIIKPVWWKIFHNSIGLLAYVVGMVSFCYAFDTWWFNLVGTWEQKVAVITVSSVVTAWTAITPLVTVLGYLKTAFGFN